PGQPICLAVGFETDGTSGMSFEVFLKDRTGAVIGMASSYQFHGQMLPLTKGVYNCRFELEPMWLASGTYTLEVRTSAINIGWDHCVDEAIEFDVPFSNPLGREFDFKQTYGYGPIALLASGSFGFCEAGDSDGAMVSNHMERTVR